MSPWPHPSTFKANWPGIAFDLMVGGWKIDEAAATDSRVSPRPDPGEERQHWLFGTPSCDSDVGNAWIAARHSAVAVAELREDLVDPPPAPERDWRSLYAAELASHPLILEDLERGGELDGVELVLERACLTVREKVVIRALFAGDDAGTIASDLGWRPQTVNLLLINARDRLRDPRWAEPKPQWRRARERERRAALVAVAS